ncbi:MAG: cation diffusion facilitator family transporter [Pirellulaceae bacterium]
MSIRRSTDSLYRDATRAAWVGLSINLVLGAVKLVGGIKASSFALLTDAFNSIGDSLASAVVLIALAVARRPADRQHPYGHTRAEAIAGSNVALLIVVTALYLGGEAVWRLPLEHEPPPGWTLWIAGANVIIKEALYRYKVRVGKRTRSSAIIANAWDHRSDALCSLSVLISLAVVRIGGPQFIAADEIAALVVVAAMLWSGIALFQKSAHELLDAQAEKGILDALRAEAEQVEGVRAVETLRVRKTGLEYLVDIHIEVDSQRTVAEGHDIGHRVKDALMKEFPVIQDVLVHVEPHPHQHKRPSHDP